MLTIFISYSRDSDEHTSWVTALANSLEEDATFHVVFDEYDLHGGRDLTHFMEEGLRCDRIVIVVTPPYVSKSEQRHGGVGYESSILSSRVLNGDAVDCHIPVLRAGTQVPSFVASRLYVDFRNDERFKDSLAQLKAALLQQSPVLRPIKREEDFGVVSRLSNSAETSPTIRTELFTLCSDLAKSIDAPKVVLETFVRTITRADRNSRHVVKAEAAARRELRRHKMLLERILAATDVEGIGPPGSDLRALRELVVRLTKSVIGAEACLTTLRNGMTPGRLRLSPLYRHMIARQTEAKSILDRYLVTLAKT